MMTLGSRCGAWARSGAPAPAYGGLCFTAQSANSSVQLRAVGSAPSVTLVKSFDGVSWSDYSVGDTIKLESVGDFVYFAAGEGGNDTFASSATKYHTFVIRGSISATGDITSIRRADLEQTTLGAYCYCEMFSGCTGLTSAPDLPATALGTACYREMFRGCTGLTSAPELPATSLSSSCYQEMFSGCTGLTSAPELPATSLSNNCYRDMFNGCTGLTSAPELPATSLSTYCYYNMFNGCTGLTSAPELPATTLKGNCYRYMFRGCTGLTSAPELPATSLSSSCYNGMFSGCAKLSSIKVNFTTAWGTYTSGWLDDVAAVGTFHKPSALSTEYGTGKIPEGWNVVNID